jgi:hypothetical protein
VLHFSEHAAYLRIEAARAARRFPVILERLTDGSLHLTAIGLLAPHLTDANHLELIAAATHKSKRDVEQLIARVRPQPDVPASVRKLPASLPTVEAPAPVPVNAAMKEVSTSAYGVVHRANRPADIRPLAPERFKVQFTVSRETHDKLRQVQALLRHVIPDGDPAVIFDRALSLLLRESAKTKCAATDRPRSAGAVAAGTRHIPAVVKREVWRRDGGQCAFRGERGRCAATSWLEFHHVVPYARGGATTTANLELRCRAHNVYEAEQQFGRCRSLF